MHQQTEFWVACTYVLKIKQALALLIIVDSKGSSPGKAGAKMAIAPDGSHFGTIGGGQIEYDLSEQALALVQQPDCCTRLFYEQHNGSEQVCGGMKRYYIINVQRLI